MSDRKDHRQPARSYPPVYEKVVPIALGLIGVALLLLLAIIFAVLWGVFPGR